MAGGNVSPRQKMINMMYLVLTALLALNVSAEILNAFKLVKGSLEVTNKGIDESTKARKYSTAKLQEMDAENVYIPIIQALYENLESDVVELEKFIGEIDTNLAVMAGAVVENGELVGAKDDDTESTDRMLAEGKEGDELESKLTALSQKIQGYSLSDNLTQVLASGVITSELPPDIESMFLKKFSGEGASYQLEEKIKGSITYDLTVGDEKAETTVWHEYNFRGVPNIGARTILTKLLTDLKNMKDDLANHAFQAAKASTTSTVFYYPVTSVTSSSYLKEGADFTVNFSLGAYDPEAASSGSEEDIPIYYVGEYTQEFQDAIAMRNEIRDSTDNEIPGGPNAVTFDGWPFVESEEEMLASREEDDNGSFYSVQAGASSNEIKGAVKQGDYWYDFKTGYTVENSGEGGYLLEAMDVMFAGVANPVILNLGAGEVQDVQCNWASVKKAEKVGGKVVKGRYEITPKPISGQEVNKEIIVTGLEKGEKVKRSFFVRVRDFPAPAARHKDLQVGDYEMSRKDACAFENGIATIVATPDENSLAALFKAKFVVTDWKVFVQKKGEARYEADWRGISGDCGKQSSVGTTVTIVDIKAKAPSGKTVDLAPITYTITK